MTVGVKPPLRIGLVGYAFMGVAHSHAWRTAPRFFDLPLEPELAALCGRSPAALAAAASRLGWQSTEHSWSAVVARDDVDLIDVCVPGDLHADIAVAALQAGKHVLCEKPLANTLVEAEAMAAAAAQAARNGVRSMVGFTYRRVPAIGLARRLVAEGRLGSIRHVRAQYLQDWILDPLTPMSWRLEKERAGSGALGDIGAHIVDLTQYLLCDRITAVTGALETFVTERPRSDADGAEPGAATEPGSVTVDDAAVFLARFAQGALGTFEATRMAAGRKNAIRVEINGSQGSLAFDFEDMNLLHFDDATEPSDTAGFRRILVTEPEHPYVAAWWPPGHLIGYEHGFTHQVVDLVTCIANGSDPSPSFADGLQVQRVLAAVEASAASGAWAAIPHEPERVPGDGSTQTRRDEKG